MINKKESNMFTEFCQWSPSKNNTSTKIWLNKYYFCGYFINYDTESLERQIYFGPMRSHGHFLDVLLLVFIPVINLFKLK